MRAFRGPKAKVVRRFGVNIFESPKYDRILEKRPNAPGVQGVGKRRGKMSEYGRQLIEKQKLKFCYGVTEKYFRNLYEKADRKKGPTGANLVVLLEQRLDNVIFRLGFAGTRAQARQLVSHRHVMVNGKKVNIASFQVKAGDVITIVAKEKSQALVKRYVQENNWREVPAWLNFNKEELRGEVIKAPAREEITSVADEQLIVELYSK